jgi:molecular chaperone IbpA
MRSTTFDYAPLSRSTIGFDRFLDMVNAAQRAGSEENYPPYNIKRLGDDRYQISLAVAGFGSDDIAVTAEQNILTIEGQKAEKKEQRECLYRGISARPLQASIQLG